MEGASAPVSDLPDGAAQRLLEPFAVKRFQQ